MQVLNYPKMIKMDKKNYKNRGGKKLTKKNLIKKIVDFIGLVSICIEHKIVFIP